MAFSKMCSSQCEKMRKAIKKMQLTIKPQDELRVAKIHNAVFNIFKILFILFTFDKKTINIILYKQYTLSKEQPLNHSQCPLCYIFQPVQISQRIPNRLTVNSLAFLLNNPISQHDYNKQNLMEDNFSFKNSTLKSNIVYLINNLHRKRFLRSGPEQQSEKTSPSTARSGPEYHGSWVYWFFQAYKDRFLIRNIHTRRYLRCGDEDGSQLSYPTTTRSGPEYHGAWVEWEIESYKGSYFLIKNTQTGRYLRVGEGEDEQTSVTTAKSGPSHHGDWVAWSIVPASSDFHVSISNFNYPKAEELLTNPKNINKIFVDESDFVVTKETVGSYVERSFKKSMTKSYSFEFTQQYGIKASMTIKADIPAVGSASQSVELSATWGINQSWTKSETHEIQVRTHLQTNTPGRFRMTGWVEILDNVKFPFTAHGKFTAKGLGLRQDGTIHANAEFNHEFIENYIKNSPNSENMKVIERGPNYVTVEISGNMNATFGMRSYTEVRKIQ